MTSMTIILASPHTRNDLTERLVRDALPFHETIRVRTREELIAALATQKVDWVFFPHWSWIVPDEIFEAHRCVIFHMTDLPYGRGGSPLQNLILRGHKSTMLTALRCVAELDAGPIYLKRDLDLSGTAEEILSRAAVLIGEMIREIVNIEPEPTAQVGEVVRFERRKPNQSAIPEGLDLAQLYNFIRMLDAEGYPRAHLEVGNLAFDFFDARLLDGQIDARVKIRIGK